MCQGVKLWEGLEVENFVKSDDREICYEQDYYQLAAHGFLTEQRLAGLIRIGAKFGSSEK